MPRSPLFSPRRTALAAATALLTPLFVAPAPAQPSGLNPQEQQILQMVSPGPVLTVTGRGEISAAPDLAEARFGAVAQAKEASAAQAQVNEIVNRIIERLTELGIDEEDIQTARISVYPVYDDRRPPRPMAGEGDGGDDGPQITGYRASNTVRVEVSDLSRVGDLIDAAIQAGANSVEGVSFELRDNTAAKRQALQEAVKKAEQEAQAVAEALGLELGPVTDVRVGQTDSVYPQPVHFARAAMAESAATPVQPGQVQVTAEVTVQYRLQGAAQPVKAAGE